MKDILAKLEIIANELDKDNKIVEADAVTDIMRKLAVQAQPSSVFPAYDQKTKFQSSKPASSAKSTPAPVSSPASPAIPPAQTTPVSPKAQGFNYQKDFKGAVSDRISYIGTYLQSLKKYVNDNRQYADEVTLKAVEDAMNRSIVELHTLQVALTTPTSPSLTPTPISSLTPSTD